MKSIAMIPARLGSQRLKQKNLQTFLGKPLIAHAIEKCFQSQAFDEVWVNSESELIGEVAKEYGASFHLRPVSLADNQTTSEQFVYEFMQNHNSDFVIQVHSIAPLLDVDDIINFMNYLHKYTPDVLLSAAHEQIECAMNGKPINFTFGKKDNSQDLIPVQKISWAITAWKRQEYINAFEKGITATYNGKIDIFEVNKLAAHVIKTIDDLRIAEALYPLIK